MRVDAPLVGHLISGLKGLTFYNVPYARFKEIEKGIENGRTSAALHGLIGRKSNNSTKKKSIDHMEDFFRKLEEEGEPHATRVVRTGR